jgi:signal transduction histidine kinase
VKGLLPRSLLGQMIALMAGALLVAQLANLLLVHMEQHHLGRVENAEPAIARFADTLGRLADSGRRGEDARSAVGAEPGFSLAEDSLVERLGLDRSDALERRFAEALAAAGARAAEVRAATGIEARDGRRHRHRGPGTGIIQHDQRVAFFSARLPDGSWLNARLDVPQTDFRLAHRLMLGTGLLYILVLAAAAWAAVRIARPMRDLANATERFQGHEEAAPITPRGPADVRRAITAFNMMKARVSALLDQKDRMLGAIGHDLRTPLASIRIRAENMEPEAERAELFATLDDMAEMLEDILALARTGRPREPVQKVDVSALADAVVEAFRALGHDVEMAPGGRVTGRIQPNLLRRAIRNLIENGVKYGGATRVAVRLLEAAADAEPGPAAAADGEKRIAIEVADRGPGIAPSELARVQEAFYRVEPSRSRETGGSGLGLTLARAAAQAHGGTLELENRTEGGLLARVILPKDGKADLERAPRSG